MKGFYVTFFWKKSIKKHILHHHFILHLINVIIKWFAATKKMKMAELKRLEEEEARKRAEESKVSKI